MLSKREKIESLIRQAYGHSSMTQLWLKNPINSKKGTIEFLENDLQGFIKKYDEIINEILD